MASSPIDFGPAARRKALKRAFDSIDDFIRQRGGIYNENQMNFIAPRIDPEHSGIAEGCLEGDDKKSVQGLRWEMRSADSCNALQALLEMAFNVPVQRESACAVFIDEDNAQKCAGTMQRFHESNRAAALVAQTLAEKKIHEPISVDVPRNGEVYAHFCFTEKKKATWMFNHLNEAGIRADLRVDDSTGNHMVKIPYESLMEFAGNKAMSHARRTFAFPAQGAAGTQL